MNDYKDPEGNYVISPALIKRLENSDDPSPYTRISPTRDDKASRPKPEPVKKG